MIALILLAAAVGDGPAPAGDDAPRVVVTQPDESKFPEITVYFEVRRPDGTFIRDARAEEFRVSEDGRDRPIQGFEAPVTVSSRPTTLVLVVDRSGTPGAGQQIREAEGGGAVRTFLAGLPEGSRVAIIAFQLGRRSGHRPFHDGQGPRAGVDRRTPPRGRAAVLRRAVDEALKLLEGQSGRRATCSRPDRRPG